MAFRVRENKTRSEQLTNRYVLTGPVSHGPGGGWRMPPHRVVGPHSHLFGHVFDPAEDKTKYTFRSMQPHWTSKQQPSSLRGVPQPSSLRGHPPTPSVMTANGSAKSNIQPLRRAVSFLDRDMIQMSHEGKKKSKAPPPFEEQDEVVYDAWPGENATCKSMINLNKDTSNKKMNRSKSFMEQPPANEGKVRKMLRKSASILYPSWLATAKRNSQNQQQQQPQQSNKKESSSPAMANSRMVDSRVGMSEVEDLHECQGTRPEQESTATTVRGTKTPPSPSATGDDNWQSTEKKKIDRATGGKNSASDRVTDVVGAARRPVQLPRLSDRNRLIGQPQSSPTTVHHASSGSVLSSSSSSTCSTLPKNKMTSKWYISSSSSSGPKSVVAVPTSDRKSSAVMSSGVERRWQSLIVLPENDDHPSNKSDHYPVGGYAEDKRKKKSAASGVVTYSGSVTYLQMERDSQAVSWEDLSDSHLYHQLHPIKALSQTSLTIHQQQQKQQQQQQQQQQRMPSCPSYESLDDYLITSDDDSRDLAHYKTTDSIHSQSQHLVYCDSFESLPRPPPPADADYSPPDISPDDSSETHRGGGRIRLKLQRLPTFIQRQEAWQRKPWNQKQQQQPKTFSGSIAETSPEPSSVGAGQSWARSHSSQEEEEEVDEEDEEEDDLSRGLKQQPTHLVGGGGLIHRRVAQPTRGATAGSSRVKASSVQHSDPVYWHDWLPPPAALLDCGCGLCRITATMNASSTYQLRAPVLLAPLPPSRPPPPHVFPTRQPLQMRQQQPMRQPSFLANNVGGKSHSIRRDVSFHQPTAKPLPPRKVFFTISYFISVYSFPLRFSFLLLLFFVDVCVSDVSVEI